jgi:hypothetical protein
VRNGSNRVIYFKRIRTSLHLSGSGVKGGSQPAVAFYSFCPQEHDNDAIQDRNAFQTILGSRLALGELLAFICLGGSNADGHIREVFEVEIQGVVCFG